VHNQEQGLGTRAGFYRRNVYETEMGDTAGSIRFELVAAQQIDEVAFTLITLSDQK
jgi:hypothetical protein